MKRGIEYRLGMYKVEARRLEAVTLAGSSLLDVIDSATRAADVRKAIKKLKRVLEVKCPVCDFVGKNGGAPSSPEYKCCPAWRRCSKYLRLKGRLGTQMDWVLGTFLWQQKKIPALFDQHWRILSIKNSLEELNKLLNWVKKLTKGLEEE